MTASTPPRPLITLIIGNGFSAGLQTELGLQDRIVRDSMFPVPEHVRYIPFPSEHESLAEQPLWGPIVFPRLWEMYNKDRRFYKTDQSFFRDTCRRLADQESRLKPGSKELVSFNTQSLHYQLRAYLFNLFRYYDIVMENTIKQIGFGKWPWPDVLHQFNQLGRLTVVSYNYECLLENTVKRVLERPPHLTGNIVVTNQPVESSVLVVKPHGSISFQSLKSLWFGNNPWLHNIDMRNGLVRPFTEFEYPPTRFSTFPDLVPPGHAGTLLANPSPQLPQLLSQAVREASILVVCGLSGRQPDTDEIDSCLSQCTCPAIHVEIPADKPTPAGKMLQYYAPSYHFCDARSEVPHIPDIVRRELEQGIPRRASAGKKPSAIGKPAWDIPVLSVKSKLRRLSSQIKNKRKTRKAERQRRRK